jgi:hypothetical protein
MIENRENNATPSNVYPRDVTSPGPDQRPGVVKSTKVKTPENQKQPRPQKSDQPAFPAQPCETGADS